MIDLDDRSSSLAAVEFNAKTIVYHTNRPLLLKQTCLGACTMQYDNIAVVAFIMHNLWSTLF